MKALLFSLLVFPSLAFAQKGLYEFELKSIEGKAVKLSSYKGKVLLIVNTASECGFTPQYKGLQELYEARKGEGLVVLGFPSNDFKGQEPGSEAEIKRFFELRYGVTFPMFSKVQIKGRNPSPLFEHLQKSGSVSWNFNKYLISRKGAVIAHFDSKVEPGSEELKKAIDRALQEK